MTGGGGAEGSITTPLSLKKQQDSNWLDVDRSPGQLCGVEDGAAEHGYQEIENMEDNSGSHTKGGQAEYDS